MTLLAALSGDSQLLADWRREGFAGTVHSVFARVVNLADSSGTLASLAVRSLDNAPGTLIVDVAEFDLHALHAGMVAHAEGGVLRIDGQRFAVRFDVAAPWQARLPDYPQDDTRLRNNLVAAHAVLGPAGLPALLETASLAVSGALRHDDVDAVRAQGRGLLGLGPGLTPSGDDFLVGLFAVLNLQGSPCHGLRVACDDIAADAEARTHPISVPALRQAARGRVRDSIRELLEEMLTGDPTTLVEPLARVLAIGATSGRDIVSGLVCGLTANLQRREERTVPAASRSTPARAALLHSSARTTPTDATPIAVCDNVSP